MESRCGGFEQWLVQNRLRPLFGLFHVSIVPLAAVSNSYVSNAGSAHKSKLIVESIQIWPFKAKMLIMKTEFIIAEPERSLKKKFQFFAGISRM